MLPMLLLIAGTGEVCAACPLETARFAVSHGRWPDGWPSKAVAEWFAADPSRNQWVRLAACESFNEDVAVLWSHDGKGFTPANAHGVLTHAWGYRQGLLTRYGNPTETLLQLEATRGFP